MSTTILLTGITGFLGSHIAEKLAREGHTVIALIRNSSNLWRYNEIGNNAIILINSDSEGYQKEVESYNPSVLIHAAWGGVAAGDRDNWEAQVANISYTAGLLNLAKNIGINHFIGLGSQAEYGFFEGVVSEQKECNPLSAYGASKLATVNIVKAFCTVHKIDWQWLRLFPMYGIREDVNWFIPMVISHALQNKDLNLTGCEQRYGYLHVDDFCRAISKVVLQKTPSGIFNVASNNSIQLRQLIEFIQLQTKTKATFNFGALPYRANQVMHMEGNSELFFSTFKFLPEAGFNESVTEIINYYKLKTAE